MLAVDDARAIVLRQARPLGTAVAPASPSLLGRVLAEPIVADLDSPPFDKAMMDGFAARAVDLDSDGAELTIVEEITAGKVPTMPIGQGQTSRIMTGAAIPSNADVVVQVEHTTMVADDRVRIERAVKNAGLNILRRGAEMERGDVVLAPGAIVGPQELGLLAAVGRVSVSCVRIPRVAVLATGDELVEPGVVPGPGQIRNSNATMLLAQVARAGGDPWALGIARDDRDHLRGLVTEGLKADVFLLSGGVSAGKLDLVPDVLRELGVEPHYHKVSMKPGKPLFFGTTPSCLVFGLPGNPVSSFACFELFVRPALRRLAGHVDPGPRVAEAALEGEFRHRSDRPTYHPARLVESPTGWSVRPQPWFGSPDLRGLAGANALVVFPVGEHLFSAGQRFPVVLLDA